MKNKNSRGYYYNLLTKSMIVIAVLSSLVVLDVKLQSAKTGENSIAPVTMLGAVNDQNAAINERFTVELVQADKPLKNFEVRNNETFELDLDKDLHYNMKIKNAVGECRSISIFTNIPSENKLSGNFKFVADLDFGNLPAKPGSNHPAAMIAWDYDSRNFVYNEELISHISSLFSEKGR